MTRSNLRSARTQLNNSSLKELALSYVGKYATTRAKLRTYLSRKIRERGWSDERAPDLDQLTNRFAELGYIDDAAYALAQARAMSVRGYGRRRLAEKLRTDGVEDEDRAAAVAHAQETATEAALRFARRRRMGPFAGAPADQQQRQKWLAAMVRAGHGYALARAITCLDPGAELNLDAVNEHWERSKS